MDNSTSAGMSDQGMSKDGMGGTTGSGAQDNELGSATGDMASTGGEDDMAEDMMDETDSDDESSTGSSMGGASGA